MVYRRRTFVVTSAASVAAAGLIYVGVSFDLDRTDRQRCVRKGNVTEAQIARCIEFNARIQQGKPGVDRRSRQP